MRSLGVIIVFTLSLAACSIERNIDGMGSKMDRIGNNLEQTNKRIGAMADRLDYLVKALKKILEQIGGGDDKEKAQLENQKKVVLTEIESITKQLEKIDGR